MIAEMERKPAADDIFSCLRPVDSMTGWWWLCMTHGGKEKPLARKLASARVDYFLPLSEYEVSRNDRGRSYDIKKTRALFPNYIFLNGDDARDVASLAAEKVCIYPVSAKTQTCLQTELESIAIALAVNPALGTESHQFQPNEKVRIIGGLYMGCEGYFDRKSTHHRVWLMLSIMGRSKGVPLEVPIEFIEPLD